MMKRFQIVVGTVNEMDEPEMVTAYYIEQYREDVALQVAVAKFLAEALGDSGSVVETFEWDLNRRVLTTDDGMVTNEFEFVCEEVAR
jgi:hypothetical protein